jgi:hypothetical protein
MRNMKKFMPKLMTAEGMFFPALLTENSLRLRVMLDMREKTNQFMGLVTISFMEKKPWAGKSLWTVPPYSFMNRKVRHKFFPWPES